MTDRTYDIDRYRDSDENSYEDMAVDLWLNNTLYDSISKLFENKNNNNQVTTNELQTKSFKYAIEHKLVSKTKFLDILLTFKYDLVIDSKNKVYAVFPSENINFIITDNSYKKYKVTSVGCVSCINCYNCDTCSFCQDCKNCETCSHCNSCDTCADCNYVSNISKSEDIHFCKKVKTSYHCYYSYNVKNEDSCYHSTDITNKDNCWFNEC